MKTEFLILVPEADKFCSNKIAYEKFLALHDRISIQGKKITLTDSSKKKFTADLNIETGKVKSGSERFFDVSIQIENETTEEELRSFTELSQLIKSYSSRISPGKTVINTVWDDVGRQWAEKSYPLINKTENMMRKLIAKFMLITVGVSWSKTAIKPELFKKIEAFQDEELYLNDLHKLDFIHLKQVLFDKNREISADDLDRLLQKKNLSKEDIESIKKYIPTSLWDKYFSEIIKTKGLELADSWDQLYKLRNKVAHNRYVTYDEFSRIRATSKKIQEALTEAIQNLGQINIEETDREQLISTYATGGEEEEASSVIELAVANYYQKLGYQISYVSDIAETEKKVANFYVSDENNTSAVIIKSYTPLFALNTIRRFSRLIKESSNTENMNINFQFILVDDISKSPESFLERLSKISKSMEPGINVNFGTLEAGNVFKPTQIP
nr:HEPN domain-containing protein [uncultured Pseudomonas sp.]